MSTMQKINVNRVESNDSAVAPIGRLFTFMEYKLTKDVIIPALSETEAKDWIKARAPRMRGNPREAVMWFLTNNWKLHAGWHIGARYVDSFHVVVVLGKVDALGRFMRKPNATRKFSYSSAPRVLSLIVERINQTL